MARYRGRALMTAAALALTSGAVALGTAGDRCSEAPRAPALAVRDETPPPTPTAGEPFPAGPVQAPRVEFTHALFYSPRPRVDPATALAGACRPLAGRFAQDEEADRPRLTVRRPATAEFPPPPPELLQYVGAGVSKAQIDAIQRSEPPLVLTVRAAREAVLTALRDATRLVVCLATETDGLIWDHATRELFMPDKLRERRLEGWEGGLPSLVRHITIHYYQFGRYQRAITLGMEKFGLPDVVVNGFARWDAEPIGMLIDVVCQTLAERPEIETAGELSLDLAALKDARLREFAQAAVYPDAPKKAVISIAVGARDEGDPDNRLLELRFDGPEGGVREQQNAVLRALFGSREPEVVQANRTEAVEAASARARARLAALRDRFHQGLAPGERLLVKAPFATAAGGREWMWLEVTEWSGRTLRGVLLNEPVDVPGLARGADVRTSLDSIFDYLFIRADGEEEGGEAEALLLGRAGEE